MEIFYYTLLFSALVPVIYYKLLFYICVFKEGRKHKDCSEKLRKENTEVNVKPLLDKVLTDRPKSKNTQDKAETRVHVEDTEALQTPRERRNTQPAAHPPAAGRAGPSPADRCCLACWWSTRKTIGPKEQPR